MAPKGSKPDFANDRRYECLVQLFPDRDLADVHQTLTKAELAAKAVELYLKKEGRSVKAGSISSWDTAIETINSLLKKKDLEKEGASPSPIAGEATGDSLHHTDGSSAQRQAQEAEDELEDVSEEDIATAKMKEVLGQVLRGEDVDADVKDIDIHIYTKKLLEHADAFEQEVQQRLFDMQDGEGKKVSDIVQALTEMGFKDAEHRRDEQGIALDAPAHEAKTLIDAYCIEHSEQVEESVSSAKTQLMAAYTKAVTSEERARLTDNILSKRYRTEGVSTVHYRSQRCMSIHMNVLTA